MLLELKEPDLSQLNYEDHVSVLIFEEDAFPVASQGGVSIVFTKVTNCGNNSSNSNSNNTKTTTTTTTVTNTTAQHSDAVQLYF